MFLAGLSLSAVARNVQFHCDLGHNIYSESNGRSPVTTTVKMFKADKWGSACMFTDFDYQRDGVAGIYRGISREFNLTPNRQWVTRVGYNGRLSSSEKIWNATRFQRIALLGGARNWHSDNFSKTFSVQLLYKQLFKSKHMDAKAPNGAQLTEVWSANSASNLMLFNGFCDLWYSSNINGNFIFLSESQLWVNLSVIKGWEGVNLSIGPEVEPSNNFVWDDHGKNNEFYAIPTLVTRWTF